MAGQKPLVAAITVGALLVSAGGPAAAGPQPVVAPVGDCEDRPTTRVVGTLPAEFHATEPTDTRTYDLRQATSVGIPFDTTEPFVIGRKLQQQARYLCVLGGTARGSRLVKDMPRPYVKQKYAGHALYVEGVEGHEYVADGVRIDEAEDGFMPLGDGFVLRNAYLSNIRDDCVENDVLSGGLITDSLFDGCYMGLSVDPGGLLHPDPAEEDEPVVLDRVLMRLKPLPDPVVPLAPDGLAHNRLWKLAQNIPPIIVRDSVLLVEERGIARNQPFPQDFTAENVTLVWLGEGPYPATVPPGVTVVTDPGVWEQARADWLTRHGYPLVPDYPGLGRLPVSGDGTVQLTWRMGSGAESYRIKRAVSSGGPYQTIAEVPASQPRTYTDTVPNGRRYFYVVTSVGAGGESGVSNEATALPLPDGSAVPAAPQDLSATADVTSYNHGHHSSVSGRVELSWNHAAGAEEYLLRRGPAPGQYTFETVVRGNTFLDVGRPVGVPVHYQVVPRNRFGTGTPSADVSAVPEAARQFPSTPRFRPPVAGNSEIQLSWLSDPLSPGTRYTIGRATTPGGPYEQVAEVTDEVEYADTGLQNDVTYYYVIQQHDAKGSSEQSQQAFETPRSAPVLPAVPAGLGATTGDGSVRLHWTAAGSATHYTVHRATAPEGPFLPLYRQVQGTGYQDNGVTPGTRYHYRVSAANSFGESAAGATVSAAVGPVDRVTPTVSVRGVRDGERYTLGAVPKASFTAHDAGGVRSVDDDLTRPDTATGAGRYTYRASAADRSANETISYATYDVRYRFAGFAGLDRTLDPDKPVPVVFRLTDARGRGVSKAVSTIRVDGVDADEWRPVIAGAGVYLHLLDARRLSEEYHTLSVVLDDGTEHRTTFRLARS
jgi:fibronectin type 3 domain-containing protein